MARQRTPERSGLCIRYGLVILSLVLFGQLLSDAAYAAEKIPLVSCADDRVQVSNASRVEADLVCSAAARTIAFFATCKLVVPPAIRVDVVDEPPKVCGVDAFGRFDAERNAIEVMNQAGCAKAAGKNKAYASLPPLEFYKSIVTHEVAHRVFRFNLKGDTLSQAAHEYVAYSAQISLMHVDVRDLFLGPIRRIPPSDLGPFVNVTLLMAPEWFGAKAYDHFSTAENGCHLLRGIADGRVRFPSEDDPISGE
ncbi:MAG: DUF6639 family protein [Pseudomonadota bacterium]